VSPLDVLLLILLVPFTVRGWWRGFCRESLGLVGLVVGALAAAATGPELASLLRARGFLPPVAALPVAWALILLAAWVAAGLLGLLADRLARALLLGGLNRLAGALFGSLKGAALLGFALLLTEQVVPSPTLTKLIAASRLGRPLEQVAVGVVRTGREFGAAPVERRA